MSGNNFDLKYFTEKYTTLGMGRPNGHAEVTATLEGVLYDTDHMEVTPGEILSGTALDFENRTDAPATFNFQDSISDSHTYEWSISVGIGISVKETGSIGVPDLFQVGEEVEINLSLSASVGQSETVEQVWSFDTGIPAIPQKITYARAIVQTENCVVPFTARVSIEGQIVGDALGKEVPAVSTGFGDAIRDSSQKRLPVGDLSSFVMSETGGNKAVYLVKGTFKAPTSKRESIKVWNGDLDSPGHEPSADAVETPVKAQLSARVKR